MKNVLASERCWEVLKLLDKEGALPLTSIAEGVGQATSNTSNNVGSLRDNDLVKKLEDGCWGITKSGQYIVRILSKEMKR